MTIFFVFAFLVRDYVGCILFLSCGLFFGILAIWCASADNKMKAESALKCAKRLLREANKEGDESKWLSKRKFGR